MKGCAVWLLAVCGLTLSCSGDGTDAATSQVPTSESWFTDVTAEVGIDFVQYSGAKGEMLLPEIMGAGTAFLDFDNDGDLDIYLTNANDTLPDAGDAEQPTNRLYRQDADGRFVDVTAETGLGDGGYGHGIAVGDIDNDGDVDVYLTNFGRDKLYRNDGGQFRDVTDAAAIEVDGWSTSAAFFDYDGDGFLDLWVCKYVVFNPDLPCTDSTGRPEYCGPKSYVPVHDVLLRNNGDGTFADVSGPSGIAAKRGAGLGVVCEDFNEDGRVDVYVTNDGNANNLWINQGDGTFRDDALLMGAALNLHGQAEAGMGVIAEDLDNDLDYDLFMTHLVEETNTLYVNQGGDRGFSDLSGQRGIGVNSMPYTGFGTVAFDIELDGDIDLLVGNGRVKRGERLDGVTIDPPWDLYAEPNLVYLNDGSGRFESISDPVAAFVRTMEVTRGLSKGDYDGDGDLDLLVGNIEGRARLYRNDAPRRGHWLIVRATDPALGRAALGAQVTVSTGERRLRRSIRSGSSYVAASPAVAHFGLGGVDTIDGIEVLWPDGKNERFPGGPVDRAIELTRGSGE